MKNIQLTVTMDQANLILEGLGELSFARVYELITQVQKQARSQLAGGARPASSSPSSPAPAPVRDAPEREASVRDSSTPTIAKLVTGDCHGE